MCYAIYRNTTKNKKYLKNYNKNKETSYLMYWFAENLYGWAMSQKLSVDGFKWRKNKSNFAASFIKAITKIVTKDRYFKLMLNILSTCII